MVEYLELVSKDDLADASEETQKFIIQKVQRFSEECPDDVVTSGIFTAIIDSIDAKAPLLKFRKRVEFEDNTRNVDLL